MSSLPHVPEALPMAEPVLSLDLQPLLSHLLEQIALLLRSGTGAATGPGASPGADTLLRQIAGEVAQLRAETAQGLSALRAARREEEDQDQAARREAVWQEAVFGPELCRIEELGEARARLLAGVQGSEPAAQALAGNLLLFHAAPVDRLANLLKDLGEAYYAWRLPSSDTDPLEHALVEWLVRRAATAGAGNTIELVQPGAPFHTEKHNATNRGVEVVAVQGWVVLRRGGTVASKARVVLR